MRRERRAGGDDGQRRSRNAAKYNQLFANPAAGARP
jgi:hypothetical protein